jgi:hypothetical protein
MASSEVSPSLGWKTPARPSSSLNTYTRAEAVAFEARDLVAQADARLALLDYIGPVDNYQLAV